MNRYFFSAACFAFAVGLVHSVLGERLIFKRMRTSGFVPVDGGGLLREAQVRIVWASWHLVTVLGWFVAALLAWLALPSSGAVVRTFPPIAIVAALVVCAVVVGVTTRGGIPAGSGC